MTGTTLKLIAMIAMILDHIWLYIPNIPYYFHWIGRISAPIFLFCSIEGYVYTSDKEKFFIRIYALSVFVSIMNFILKIDGSNINFIRTILLTLSIVFVIDKFKNEDKYAKMYLYSFIAYEFLNSIFVSYIINYTNISKELLNIILSMTNSILYLDGGIIFVLIGMCMYLYRNKKYDIAISFIVCTFIYVHLFNTTVVFGINNLVSNNVSQRMFSLIFKGLLGFNPMNIDLDLIYGNPQWMMVFSLPFILLYNQNKGKGLKYLFYIVYPLHIIILNRMFYLY